jgi:hypothetical protein
VLVNNQPPTNNKQQTTNNQQPTTNNQQPTPNNIIDYLIVIKTIDAIMPQWVL